MTGEDLIKLRQRMRWSQRDAANMLGCSTRSIANWESEKNVIPRSIALAASAVLMSLPPYSSKGPMFELIHDLVVCIEFGVITNQSPANRDYTGYFLERAQEFIGDLKDYETAQIKRLGLDESDFYKTFANKSI